MDSLLEYVPETVAYHRVPLDDSRNALGPWRRAVEHFVPRDRASGPSSETNLGRGEAAPGGISIAEAESLGKFLDANQQAIQFLGEGLRLGRVQFPEVTDLEQVAADSEFVGRLGEVAQLLVARFKLLAFQGDTAAAAEQVVRLHRFGEMISGGEGQVLHYLTGLWIRSSAQQGIAWLAAHDAADAEAIAGLLAAIEHSLALPNSLIQSLRVDFCSLALRQLDGMPDQADVETLVDRLLELYYGQRPAGEPQTAESPTIIPLGRWHDRRRQQIRFLLCDHPRPFDKVATARLMGEMVADGIAELQSRAAAGGVDLGGRFRRLRRYLSQRRLEKQTRYWPAQLAPGFTYELSTEDGGGAVAADESADVADHRFDADFQLPSEAQLIATHKRILRVANPVGLVLTEHLLAFDYSPFMLHHRAKLQETRQILAARLARLVAATAPLVPSPAGSGPMAR